MSTHESNRNSSQGKQEGSTQGNSTHAQHQHSDETRRPLPFDDDDASDDGADEGVSSNPKLPPPEYDF